ncbi:DUF1566 domain-containing protein [Desulfonatronum lacustre]|uniref:Lcl C-terminal domain-containing protein n=1 Tax=Desulfonatronum lacustre TaxID=66849 RepID=UPI00048D95C1|nr:DUF1566 domain-containing protein [Desulfonatronum lacustre]
MRKMWRMIFGTAALTFMLCLTGLVMSGEAQAQRFVDNGDGTVTDTATGLMWTKDADPFGRLNWDDAMLRCTFFSIRGISGWRLPSKDELVAIRHAIQGGHPFTGVQSSYYWSSTHDADYPGNAWSVSMSNINVNFNYTTLTFHVWPVRAGQ